MIKHSILIPIISKFRLDPERYSDITTNNHYPTESELITHYGEIHSHIDLKRGDVIKIKSEQPQFIKHYFVAENGLEEIKFGE